MRHMNQIANAARDLKSTLAALKNCGGVGSNLPLAASASNISVEALDERRRC
jgi:hypothetical protein|tara:strand:- start:2649 stop:2804 length:156 start_codon:yes stop_codon:yes gene_type:complete